MNLFTPIFIEITNEDGSKSGINIINIMMYIPVEIFSNNFAKSHPNTTIIKFPHDEYMIVKESVTTLSKIIRDAKLAG